MQDNVTAAQKRVKKRIGIDTRNTALPFGTGVSTYATIHAEICRQIGFTTQLLNAPAIPGKISRLCHALLPSQKLTTDFSAPDIYRVAQTHFKIYRRAMTLRVADPPDLMHWTYPLPLFMAGCKNIVTIHDLIPLQHATLSTINGRRLHRLLTILLKKFDGILTVSETVREEIINLFGISPSRVENLYQAVDVTLPDERPPPICPPEYFVTAGSVEPRKNIRRLIAAHRASNVALPLVILGPDGDGASDQLADMGSNVLRLPYLSRSALLATMKTARAVLFPSLAEGFGLPIAEAFALGVPVLTSKGGATEEIAGGAALLINPERSEEISEAIRQLAQDDHLCASLSARGAIRAEFFSITNHAIRVSRYYEKILNPKRFS